MDTRHTIGHRVYTEGEPDSRGNPVPSWADPVDVEVYAVYPRTSVEPTDPNRTTLIITGLAVLMPPGVSVDHRDRFVWQGEEYEVDGDLADWTHGPFGYTPGAEVLLKKAGG